MPIPNDPIPPALRSLSRCVFPAAIALALAAAPALDAGDRPQWGERHTRNQVSDEKGLPESFDPASGKNVKWSARLGTRSYSTPAVARGRILIGTNNGAPRDPRHQGDRGVLLCLDERDGSFIWQLVVPKLADEPWSLLR
jgi:outer membrane protein assembly factor BamB